MTASFEALPKKMRDARRWLLWREEPNPDPTKKPRKVPYYIDGNRRIGTLDTAEDLERLAGFEDAFMALQRGGHTGLGFALGPDGTGQYWQGIDFDHLDQHPELVKLISAVPGYKERSPSGNGIHAVGYGKRFASLGSNASGIEAYASGRFFTVTGDAL